MMINAHITCALVKVAIFNALVFTLNVDVMKN